MTNRTEPIAGLEAPPIPGLRLRPFRGFEADIPGLAAANQALRDAAGIEEVVVASDMERDYRHLSNCDLDRDLLVAELDGRIVGYARCEWRDLADGTRSFTTITVVEPRLHGTGLVDALIAWAEARLLGMAAAIRPADRRPGALVTFTFGADADQAAALERRGWIRTGMGWEMVRPTLDDVPDVALPEGLVVRPTDRDETLLRRIWDAATEAFADERGEQVQTDEDWQNFLEDPDEDPSLWAIAWDGDEIAGGVMGIIHPEENRHHGRDRGVVDAVWVRRPWRRRGLARALIADVLVRLRERGMTSAYLGVDGLNPNQASTLYRSLGFEPASTSYDWKKPLPAELGGYPIAPPAAEPDTTTEDPR
jgi:mycothiol synthase